MTVPEDIRADLKRLSARAMQAKMDLHDLSEELPLGVERVIEVAARVRDSYAALEAKRAELQALAGS